MLPRTIDIYRVLPEMVWCCFGVLVMLMQPFVRSRHFFTFLALIGTLAGTAASVTAAIHAGPASAGWCSPIPSVSSSGCSWAR